MISIEEQLALADIHPGLKAYIDSGFHLNPGLRYGTSIKTARGFVRFLREQQESIKQSKPKYIQVESEIIVPDWASELVNGSPTSTVTLQIKVHKPRQIPKDGCPAMVNFAPSGYVVHDFMFGSSLCRRWNDVGGIAIDIAHRLAPEYPFPIPVLDCLEAVRWVAVNRADLGLNMTKGFIVAGESVGAQIALSVAHLCHEHGISPPLTGIFAGAPWGVNNETVPQKYKDHFLSLEQLANPPIKCFDKEAYDISMEHYKPDMTSPLAFPVAFPDHSYLPRTYFQVCGLDPMRDCGLILEQVLKDAGVETKMDLYPGLVHCYWLSLSNQPWGGQALVDSKHGMQWLLRKGES